MDNSFCVKLHKEISTLPLYSFDTMNNITFTNGIYFVFENGEEYHGYNRIVRVGSHIKQDRLKERLKNHFKSTSKASSIFIKNVGRVFLNVEDRDYLDIWNITKPSKLSDEKRNIYNKKRDIVKEKYYETKAADYIRKNMRIAVMKIDDASKRLPYEEAIIASLNKTKDFNSSSNWLGKNSPIEEIRMSGMWLSEGLNSNVLTAFEQDDLIELIKKMQHG